jgi:hypothetical protein
MSGQKWLGQTDQSGNHVADELFETLRTTHAARLNGYSIWNLSTKT